MGVPGNANPLLLVSAAAAPTGYTITRSLRFNSADSAYLNRTPSSAGNRKTWTWSGWVKPSNVSAYETLFSTDYNTSGNYGSEISFTSGRNLVVYQNVSGTAVANVSTQGVFRDASAWYHFVVSFDTTNSTANDRVKIYVNGELAPVTVTTSPAQNAEGEINAAEPHYIGAFNLNGSLTRHFNGYLADVHFIDGQALGPSYFGEYDTNNVWQPKAFNSGGTTINDGTTWSSTSITTATGISTNVGNDITDLFDGDVTTGPRAAGIGGTGIIQWSSGTIQGNVSVHTYTVGSPGDLVYFNGTTQLQVSPAANGWVYLGYVDLTELRFSYPSSGNVLFVDAIKVDGVIMIDNTTTTLSYGTNGFHLDFSDATSTTTIAEDSSGNNNDWTANNISVTAGAGNDSLFDSPTNANAASDTGAGGEVSGCYATLNPIEGGTQYGAYTPTLTNGNLDIASSSGWKNGPSTFAVSSGKWYSEVTVGSTSAHYIGICGPDFNLNDGTHVGNGSNTVAYYSTGQKNVNASLSSYGASYTTGDVIGTALDLDAGQITFYKNGTSQGVAQTGLSGEYFFVVSINGGSTASNVSFGQRAFAHPVSGFQPWTTALFDDPTIADGSTAMDVALWTGNGSSQSITGLSISPDLVWVKQRNTDRDHCLCDIVRGTSKRLRSNTTDAETTESVVTAFNSDGFSIGSDNGVNQSGGTFVGWAWDGGSSTVSNTDGSITSSVRANASAGFSIVTYSGNLTAAGSATIGHGLNAAPQLIISKSRTVTGAEAGNWAIQHSSLTATHILRFDTAASSAKSGLSAPTSTVFTTTYTVGLNTNGNDYVAYCWAPVEGYSAFGSYTGNGSSDGPFVYTGHRSRWLLIKVSAGTTDSWRLYDTARSPYNLADERLLADSSVAESESVGIDFLSNGFKLRSSDAAGNGSGNTYIFASFASNPFKTSRAR